MEKAARVDIINLYAPYGLLHRTIWEAVLGNCLDRDRHLIKKYLAVDWRNHLSVM